MIKRSERRREIKARLKSLKKMLKWNKRISHKDFGEKYIHLPANNSFGAGKSIDFRYTPHLLKPLSDLDNPTVQEIYLMFASQLAKTTFLAIAFGKNAKIDNKTCVWMIPTKDMISRYQKEKIDSIVDVSPALKELIDDTRLEQKRAVNKTSEIRHGGSTTYLIGSNVDADKKAVSAKLVICDEIDEMGGLKAIMPLWERAKTFLMTGAKLLCASTKKKDDGAITEGFNLCEQKNYLGMECPHCGKLTEIKRVNLRYVSETEYRKIRDYKGEFTDEFKAEYTRYASDNVYYECTANRCEIRSEDKNRQVLAGKIDWIVKGNSIDPVTVGYSANSLLSFFVPFDTMIREYLKAYYLKDPEERREALQAYFEGYFNEPYKDDTEKEVAKDDILRLSNGLNETNSDGKFQVPTDVAMMTMTIDTQKDHYWYSIYAWQYGSIGNYVTSGRAETKRDLDILRKQIFIDPNGEIKEIDFVTIDLRGIKERSAEVLEWVEKVIKEEGREDYIYPSMGMDGKKMVKLSDLSGKVKGTDIKYLAINNLLAKDYANDMINRSIDLVNSEEGSEFYKEKLYYINNKPIIDKENRIKDFEDGKRATPSTRLDFERQMASEHKVFYVNPKTGKVDDEESWQKRVESVRNEEWDNFVASCAIWIEKKGHMLEKPRELTKLEIWKMQQQMAQKEIEDKIRGQQIENAKQDYF